MVSSTDKEKFFAQLDSLDESTETESELETDREPVQEQSRKRQKLNPTTSVEKEVLSVDVQVKDVKSSRQIDANWSRASRPAAVSATVNKRDHDEHLARKPQPDADNNTTRVTRARRDPAGRDRQAVKGLFKNLTFYFIPNDDVAKPRRLRIQSAISQGATWARELGPGVTHVIVDPEITASAIAKYVKEKRSISGVSFVKMNWLIESLSHKSVRNPSDSRFQLRGTDVALVTSTKAHLPPTTSHQVSLAEPSLRTDKNAPGTSVTTPEEDFDHIVQNLKAAPDLPFDEEIDFDNFLSFDGGDEEADRALTKHHKSFRTGQKSLDDHSEDSESKSAVDPRNAGFSCMQSNPGKQSSTPNDRTIAILQQMARYYDRTGDNWRTLAYRRAITALRKHDTHVTTSKEARKINGIGTRLADKIEEIVTTDRLKRLDAVLSDPDDTVLQLFMGIYGVGIRQAKAWMEQGYRTLEDLQQHVKLTSNQKIGIEHHTDFARRIPRSEVKQHGDIVAQALKGADRDLQSVIGGSYRRGNADSGDIDIIVTHPTATLQQLQTWIFDTIVPHLFKIGFMKCALATSRPSTSTPQRPTPAHLKSPSGLASTGTTSSGSKFHGASQLPFTSTNPSPPWRRIDLLLVPPTSIGAALIYFTGNDIFNRSLRLLASKKGKRLNQHGLYKDVMRGKGRVKITEGELVEGRSEKKIFEILGVPWRPATERNC